ncbi:MAG: stage 0 sporulation family protein [Firmicutes bacterium]|nr:stage 0 sporulation family protein [Bacillota bacterium]
MTKVVGVKFRTAGKTYYFDPLDFSLKAGEEVIVETARGIELGIVAFEVTEVEDNEVVQPLKPIIRKADEEDRRKNAENIAKREKALEICQEKIDARKLEMKLVDVEYTFDNSKVIFYFTADGRVDFRELVKDLAAAFKMRIELRQIGVRDETKMMGGIGPCGRELCCHSWMRDFNTVSIKMAKNQNLSLNPTKISGICGRLMCCLQYENDTYVDLKKGMPEMGERISTIDGPAVVYDVNILENRIKTRLVLEEAKEDGQAKLSSEYYTYKKEEIKRDPKKERKEFQKKNRNPKKVNDDIDLTKLTEEELAALED